MLVNRQNLAAGVETAFEFDNYAANSVVVKNETAGEILFCDGPFDAAKAAHIPAFSWQSFIIQVFYGGKPKFYVKAAAAGAVEIDFGSVMAGCASGDGFGKLAGSSGVATGGTVTTLVDATKNLPADLVKDQYIAIIIDGVEYVRKISANNANTFTFDVLVPKAAATAVVEKSGGGKVTITATPEGSYANAYEVAVVQGEGASAETAAAFEGGILNITLGTNATAAEVAAEVDVLEGFSAVATVAGVLEALAEPVAFSGGVDEVKPAAGDAYAIKAKGGVSDVQISGPVGIDPATNAVQLSGSNVVKSGQKNVTTAGTQVALGATQDYKEINIIAKPTNTGLIYIGESTVDSTTGAILPAGGYVTLQFVDIADVYIDSSVNGEGVSWIGVV